jgi:RecB family exonuclease
VELSLGQGRKIRVRGRIDRVDRAVGGKGEAYAIWDYKTGGSKKYDRADPFRQGRVIQQALYQAMALARLRESVSPKAVIREVGYFFPSAKTQGERISWPPGELSAWKEIVLRLCGIAATGCFPATTEVKDCAYCDYNGTICSDIDKLVEAARMKLANPDNRLLDDFRFLRSEEKEGKS